MRERKAAKRRQIVEGSFEHALCEIVEERLDDPTVSARQECCSIVMNSGLTFLRYGSWSSKSTGRTPSH